VAVGLVAVVLMLVWPTVVVQMVVSVTTVQVVDARPSYGRQRWTSRPVRSRFAADDCVALAGRTAVAVFPVPVRLTVLLLLALDILFLLVLVTVVAITWSGTRNPPLFRVRRFSAPRTQMILDRVYALVQ
jgi:hypothetical protein